jgi:catecholate siderophore receptor
MPTPEQKATSPYVNPAAPYMVEKSGSTKITEPLADTPKTITAISKEVLEDKATTSVRELARQTPGVTLGFAEGGNAFGDSLYIRGFNARGDIFVDGMRDAGNASRETFAVEQVEIYKGPGGTIAGRGVTGGAINIITKKPNEVYSFGEVSTMFGTDKTVRTTVNLNQVICSDLAVRGNLLFHDSHVAGRDDAVQDQRWGGLLAATIKPTDAFKFTIDYYRLRTDGVPDFGVPFDPRTRLPVTETAGVPRDTWYGDARPGRDLMNLLATAALFQTTKENAREPSPLGNPNPPANIARVRRVCDLRLHHHQSAVDTPAFGELALRTEFHPTYAELARICRDGSPISPTRSSIF